MSTSTLVEEKDGTAAGRDARHPVAGQADVVKAKLGDNANQILQAGPRLCSADGSTTTPCLG